MASHCGVCFGCLVRRSAFAASRVADNTSYLFSLNRADLRAYLADKSMERAVREFVARGVDEGDFAAMALPAHYSTREAADLVQRSIGELSLLP